MRGWMLLTDGPFAGNLHWVRADVAMGQIIEWQWPSLYLNGAEYQPVQFINCICPDRYICVKVDDFPEQTNERMERCEIE